MDARKLTNTVEAALDMAGIFEDVVAEEDARTDESVHRIEVTIDGEEWHLLVCRPGPRGIPKVPVDG